MNARALAPLTVLLVGLASGCAEDRMSLEIRQTCYPTDDCTFSDKCDLQYLGTFVQSGAFPMRVYFEVANQLSNNGDPGSGRVNSNDAHVTGVTVEFSGALSGKAALPDIANQLVPAEGSAVIGIWIPAGGSGSVTADVRLTGYYDNGREFETGPYPVNYIAGGTPGDCATGQVQTCPPAAVTGVTRSQAPAACVAP